MLWNKVWTSPKLSVLSSGVSGMWSSYQETGAERTPLPSNAADRKRKGKKSLPMICKPSSEGKFDVVSSCEARACKKTGALRPSSKPYSAIPRLVDVELLLV